MDIDMHQTNVLCLAYSCHFFVSNAKICHTLLVVGRFLYFDIPVEILERRTLFLEFNYMLLLCWRCSLVDTARTLTWSLVMNI